MSRGKPCERMSRVAKVWHGFISSTNGWGRRGVWDVCAKAAPAETERQEHAAAVGRRCRAA